MFSDVLRGYRKRPEVLNYLIVQQWNFVEHEHLKLVSAIFYQISIFQSNDRSSKSMKNVFYFIEKALSVLEIFKSL